MLSEANIIAYLKAEFPKYIGDDAAVIKQSGGKSYIVTKDILIEDIHFRTSYFDPLSLAQKALHVNLSDVSAMGAKPNFCLLGISIPKSKQKYAEEFLTHFSAMCKKVPIILIGGDTTKSPDKIFISVTVIGTALSEQIKYRDTANIGDFICVAGDLGTARLGFIMCEKFIDGFEDYKNAFLKPTAKTQEGIWLSSQTAVTSLMDISDGLYTDLKRLCKASNVQGEIDLDRIKPSTKIFNVCERLKIDPIELMLIGGEDYSLLFTVDATRYVELNRGFIKKFGYAIQHIGYTAKGDSVKFILNGKYKNIKLQAKQFSHFGEVI